MALDLSPPHGLTANFAFTDSVYRDTYPAVDPKRPELSQKGKVILITGASRGIGLGIAEAFARANAKAIIITARKQSTLSDTEAAVKAISPSTEVLAVSLEVTDEASVRKAFETIASKYPKIDVLVNNAGSFVSGGQNLASADAGKWWQDFEVNVKGTLLVTRAFLSHLKPEQPAAVVTLSSGAAFAEFPGGSSYSLTKLADLKFAAHIALENPNVHSVAVHPGVVNTDMADDNPFFIPYALDTKELAGNTIVWTLSEEAKFLTGRYISVNWDVEEVISRKDEILSNNYLKAGLPGLKGGKRAEVKG